MRKVGIALSGVILLSLAQPAPALEGALEVNWSDTVGSNTLVTESSCTTVSGPAPYNTKCTYTAVANNLPSASPQRGRCEEVVATLGVRRVFGPCRAEFSVTMRVNRVRADRQNPAVYACNGTSVNQETDGPEPVQVKGSFTFENSDGMVRQIPVDVTISGNVLSFQGSLARIGTEDIVDEVKGSFPIRCRQSTGNGYSGEYNYVV